MRAHLADHAAAAGRIDELLPDAGYLLAADPARLLPALNHARTTQARRIDAVYRRCADHLRSGSRQMRGSYLDELEACRAGLQQFAAEAAAEVPDRPWRDALGTMATLLRQDGEARDRRARPPTLRRLNQGVSG
jgi:hypothetical protein